MLTPYDLMKGKAPEQKPHRAQSSGSKQVGCEYLPQMGARSTITSGDPTNRALGNYAKSAKSPEMDDYLLGVPYSRY